MKLLTKAQEEKLLANGRNRDQDHAPVVKFFNPMGSATWLLSALDEDGFFHGLCDLGVGSPEIGPVRRAGLENFRNNLTGLGLERDLHFKPSGALSLYADAARKAGHIVDYLS